MSLPYGEGTFDAATVGFGARNFADLDRGLAEMCRVVRPGGRVVVLEITTPTRAPLSLFYALWFDRAVPALGRLAASIAAAAGRGDGAGDGRGERDSPSLAEAYAYLPRSVKRFPGPDELASRMERAGMEQVAYLLAAGGIIAIHSGTVADRGPA
jgi:demethylmenaquinone methyltransferase/2-methoxy-6-polyprenyl-1,4-benzoquinol methylase